MMTEDWYVLVPLTQSFLRACEQIYFIWCDLFKQN